MGWLWLLTVGCGLVLIGLDGLLAPQSDIAEVVGLFLVSDRLGILHMFHVGGGEALPELHFVVGLRREQLPSALQLMAPLL
jgi:hypothetical protein